MLASSEIEKIEKKLTLPIISPVLGLSKLQIRSIFSNVLREELPTPEQPIPEASVKLLLTASMLENLTFLNAEQRTLILQQIVGLFFAPNEDLKNSATQLIFVDGRYIVFTGSTGFVSLDSGDNLDGLPEPPIETISYNLDELCRRGLAKIYTRIGENLQKDLQA
ncbi:hypothetical protein EBZ39_04730 [bacterium]|nr:hypothetical protein [bacterium]